MKNSFSQSAIWIVGKERHSCPSYAGSNIWISSLNNSMFVQCKVILSIMSAYTHIYAWKTDNVLVRETLKSLLII